jgi:hypothetical protein
MSQLVQEQITKKKALTFEEICPVWSLQLKGIEHYFYFNVWISSNTIKLVRFVP